VLLRRIDTFLLKGIDSPRIKFLSTDYHEY